MHVMVSLVNQTTYKRPIVVRDAYNNIISLAWPDRFFPFLFVVAEKRVWSGSHTHLVFAPGSDKTWTGLWTGFWTPCCKYDFCT